MKKLQINKHRYGWSIMLTSHLFLNLDINDWWFLPNLEFDRRPGPHAIFIFRFCFLCISLTFYKWRFDDAK